MTRILIIILFVMQLTDMNSYTKNNQQPESPELDTPMYIDEGLYTGDELEMIKLINLRMKYLWEVDENNYMSLFHKDSPINAIPLFKIESTKLRSEISIREQKNVYQAVVSVTELRYDSEDENNPTYVFQKDKKEGAEWLIRDID